MPEHSIDEWAERSAYALALSQERRARAEGLRRGFRWGVAAFFIVFLGGIAITMVLLTLGVNL